MTAANVTLVQNLYAAFQRGDIGAIVGAAVPDTVWHAHGRTTDHPALGVHKGHRACRGSSNSLPKSRTWWRLPRASSMRRMTRCSCAAATPGRCATPVKPVSSEWLHMFTIRDGKLAGF